MVIQNELYEGDDILSKKLIGFFLTISLVLFLNSCKQSQYDSMSTLDFENNYLSFEIEEKQHNNGEINPSTSSGIYYMQRTPYNPANIHTTNEVVATEQFVISTLKVVASKHLPENIKKEELGESFVTSFNSDGKGTILSSHTYIFMEITVTNAKNEEQMIYLNSLGRLVQLDSTYNTIDKQRTVNGEPIYRSNGLLDPNEKDYYHELFLPNETKTFTIIYLFDDEDVMADNWYLTIGYSIDNSGDEENKTQLYKININ